MYSETQKNILLKSNMGREKPGYLFELGEKRSSESLVFGGELES